MDNSEQWKHGGDCDKCRRKKYCGTPCRASVERDKAFVAGLVAEAFVNALKRKV